MTRGQPVKSVQLDEMQQLPPSEPELPTPKRAQMRRLLPFSARFRYLREQTAGQTRAEIRSHLRSKQLTNSGRPKDMDSARMGQLVNSRPVLSKESTAKKMAAHVTRLLRNTPRGR